MAAASCDKRENDFVVPRRQTACADRLKWIAGPDDELAQTRLLARAQGHIIGPIKARKF